MSTLIFLIGIIGVVIQVAFVGYCLRAIIILNKFLNHQKRKGNEATSKK